MGEFGADPALVPTASSQQAVSTKGFDPGDFKPKSYDGKPRHMPKDERRELDALVNAARSHMESLTPYRRGKLLRAFPRVSPINCSWQHYALAECFVYELAELIDAPKASQDTPSPPEDM